MIRGSRARFAIAGALAAITLALVLSLDCAPTPAPGRDERASPGLEDPRGAGSPTLAGDSPRRERAGAPAASATKATTGGSRRQPGSGESAAIAPATEPSRVGPGLPLRFLERGSDEPIANVELEVVLASERSRQALRIRTDEDGRARLEGPFRGEEFSAQIRSERYLAESCELTVSLRDDDEPPERVVHLTPGERVIGRVVDDEGLPIANARVVVYRAGVDGPERATRASAGDGRFEFSALAPGDAYLEVTHPGHRSSGPVHVAPPEELEVILPRAPDARLQVVDADGVAVEGARLRARIPDARSLLVPRLRPSDTDGISRVETLPLDDELQLTVTGEHAAFPTCTRSVRVGDLARGVARFEFERPRTIRGRVTTDVSTSDASGSIRVVLRGLDRTPPVERLLAATSLGEFRFERLPSGRYELLALDANRGLTSPAQSVDLVSSLEAELELRLQVAGDHEIRGRVLSSSGVPRALVPVTVEVDGERREVVTDREGRFRFPGLSDTPCVVIAGGRSIGVQIVENVRPVSPSSASPELELRLEAPGRITGRVALEGPSRGFTVRATRVRDGVEDPPRVFRFTASVPRFTLDSLPPGEYRVELLEGSRVADRIDGVRVREGETTGSVRLGASGDADRTSTRETRAPDGAP